MENKNLETLRHSCSHLLAAAIMELWPKTKLAIGPAIENGFYYDFDFSELPEKISETDFPKIEAKMEELKKKGLPFEKKTVSLSEAKDLFKDQPYKLELIEDLTKEGENEFSTYKIGDFLDLCAGPHVEKSTDIGAFKLLSIAGAYWRGTEKNKMLTRIYGTCFPIQKELDDYLNFLKEAEKRDHRQIGKDLDLYSVDEYVGPGLVLWHPKLSAVREQIELYWRSEHRKRGYQYVYTPHVGLGNLWKTSGHLQTFKEGLYPPMAMELKNKEEVGNYYIKPMSCPFHIRIYKSRPRSYRELPIRYCELGNVYRYEESGVLHGLLRVRGFTQDDAHIICREDQFEKEINDVLDFALEINAVFGFNKLNVYLSLRDQQEKEKYVGESEIWDKAEKILREILERRKVSYKEDVGGAKFYGPAIDLKAVDALGREWQGTTIQLDFNLPQRFGITYIGEDGKEHTPVMIHRTLLGSMERFVGTLIEQYGGAFPVWLAPMQAKIIPVSEKSADYAQIVASKLQKNDIRVELDDRNERMQAKIRDAEREKVPYMLIVGPKEAESASVSVRVRGEKDLGSMAFDDFLALIKEDIVKKRQI
ncbi:MAG: threonine--tRNA ligase [Patescibacteria group bacterium]|nr:threonine--tRNA ligase [Patescibacteria group bacterium]